MGFLPTKIITAFSDYFCIDLLFFLGFYS